MKEKILVTGATGNVGRALAAELAKAGALFKAATRSPETATSRAGLGNEVELVRFDLELAETFDGALDGVDRVFLVARPGDDHAERLAFPLIDAMEKRGIRHVVDLSALGAEMRPSFALRKIELRLEASSLAFTHLRPNFYMQMFTGGALLQAVRSRAIRLPAALARISWIDARDVASVAAAALLADDQHQGRAYALTGDQALDHAEVAALIREATGFDVRYEAVSEDEARLLLSGAGFPPPWIERLVGFYRLVREGFAAPTLPAVKDLLGRPARTFAAFAREHAATWS